MLGSLVCRPSSNAVGDRRHPASRLVPTGDGKFLRLIELMPTWAVYQGLTGLDHGLEVVFSGLAAQLGRSGGVLAQVRSAGSTETAPSKKSPRKT